MAIYHLHLPIAGNNGDGDKESQEKMAAFLWGFPLPVQNTQNLVVNPHTRWHIKTVLSNTIGQYAWIQGHWKLCGDVF